MAVRTKNISTVRITQPPKQPSTILKPTLLALLWVFERSTGGIGIFNSLRAQARQYHDLQGLRHCPGMGPDPEWQGQRKPQTQPDSGRFRNIVNQREALGKESQEDHQVRADAAKLSGPCEGPRIIKPPKRQRHSYPWRRGAVQLESDSDDTLDQIRTNRGRRGDAYKLTTRSLDPCNGDRKDVDSDRRGRNRSRILASNILSLDTHHGDQWCWINHSR